jgi:hypothetical protein
VGRRGRAGARVATGSAGGAALFLEMTKGPTFELGVGSWAEDLSGPECVGQVSPSPGIEEAEDQWQLGAPGKQSDDE